MTAEKVDISDIKEFLVLYDLGERDLFWVGPENIIGLNKEQIISQNDRENLQQSGDNDLENSSVDNENDDEFYVIRYLKICYGLGEACLPGKCQRGITESYIRALIFMIVEYHSLSTALYAPTNISNSEAIKCLPIFIDAMLNHNRATLEIFDIPNDTLSLISNTMIVKKLMAKKN